MATYPESPLPIYPYQIIPRWGTIRSAFDSGKEQRRQKITFPVFDAVITYGKLTSAEAQTIYDFFMARKGGYEAFYLYDLSLLASVSRSQSGLYVGTGDASTEVFDIPGRSTSSVSVYLDGVEQTLTTDYVLLTGGGESAADRIDFVSPPSSGEVITVDFTGYLRMRVVFAEDAMSMALFMRNYFKINEIKFRGIQAA